MTERKYEIREAGNGFLSKLGTGVVAVGSVAAAVVAVSPQGAALESLIYNPESMPANNVASGANGSTGTGLEGEQSAATAGGVPPTLEDYLVLGDIFRGGGEQLSGQGSAFVELGSILSNDQGGGSFGNVSNSTQYASGGGNSATGDAGNVTGSTPTAGGGNGQTGNTGGNGNTTSPTPGGGEYSGEDSYGEDSHGEDSHGEDSHGEDSHGEDSHSEDSHGED